MVGLARYLHNLNLVTYSATGAGATIFLNRFPDTTVLATRLWEYGGLQPDGQLGYDTKLVQVMVRGVDEVEAPVKTKADAIYDALHGLGTIALPDGTFLINCLAQQPPCSAGVDERNRAVYVFNLHCEVRNVTTNRE